MVKMKEFFSWGYMSPISPAYGPGFKRRNKKKDFALLGVEDRGIAPPPPYMLTEDLSWK